jgi:hypothetical protein
VRADKNQEKDHSGALGKAVLRQVPCNRRSFGVTGFRAVVGQTEALTSGGLQGPKTVASGTTSGLALPIHTAFFARNGKRLLWLGIGLTAAAMLVWTLLV